jgi:hypothetical protein
MSATVFTFPRQGANVPAENIRRPPRRRLRRRKYEQPLFKSLRSIIDASEEDLLRDVHGERQKAVNKLAGSMPVCRRFRLSCPQLEKLTMARTKLCAALVKARTDILSPPVHPGGLSVYASPGTYVGNRTL